MYQLLGSVKTIDWSKVFIFLIDERYISNQHADSNTKMCRDSIVTPSGLPEAQYIVPNTELPLVRCLKSQLLIEFC